MKRDDVDQLMAFLHAAFPRLQVEQIQLYSRLLEQESNTDAASRAILRGVKTWKFAPSYADLHEMIKAEKRLDEPDEQRPAPVKFDRTMPNWVRRYVCARFLFSRFGRDQDMRPFPEMRVGFETGEELMPDGEWEAEAATIDLATAWRALLTGGMR
jgi:hypothetical protein